MAMVAVKTDMKMNSEPTRSEGDCGVARYYLSILVSLKDPRPRSGRESIAVYLINIPPRSLIRGSPN